MQKAFLILIASVLLFSCNEKRPYYMNYFLGNAWLSGDRIVMRNDSILSPCHFDTVSKQFTSDTSFLLEITDSTIVYKQFASAFTNPQLKNLSGDTLLIDTVKYDFIIINEIPRLILYLPGSPLILTGADVSIKITETKRIQPTKFVISGYSIGQNIDRNLLKTRGIYNYRDYSIEDCELADNADIQIKIIGYNTIFSIERHNIPDSKVKEIKDIVTSKLGVEPQYSPMKRWAEGANYEYEFYRWNKNYVRVMLSRSRYAGTTNYYKYLLDKDSWNLSYDDEIQKAILIEKYKSLKQTDAIIE